MVFLDQDSLLMTYGDRSPKLFKAPFAPDFPDDEIGPANAVVGVETEEGTKILMTAQIGGEGNAYGVALCKAAESGRVAPERESLLLLEAMVTLSMASTCCPWILDCLF